MQKRKLADGTTLKLSIGYLKEDEASFFNRPTGSYEGILELNAEGYIVTTNPRASWLYPEQQFRDIYRSIRDVRDFFKVDKYFSVILENR